MPKANWNIGIQILRGIAATLVVLHHSLEESLAVSPHILPNWAISFGASGGDIFFVISGFIIYSVTYGPESRTQQSAISFLIKRFYSDLPVVLDLPLCHTGIVGQRRLLSESPCRWEYPCQFSLPTALRQADRLRILDAGL